MSRTTRRSITSFRRFIGPSSVREPRLCGETMQLGYPAPIAGKRVTKRLTSTLRRVADARVIEARLSEMEG